MKVIAMVIYGYISYPSYPFETPFEHPTGVWMFMMTTRSDIYVLISRYKSSVHRRAPTPRYPLSPRTCRTRILDLLKEVTMACFFLEPPIFHRTMTGFREQTSCSTSKRCMSNKFHQKTRLLKNPAFSLRKEEKRRLSRFALPSLNAWFSLKKRETPLSFASNPLATHDVQAAGFSSLSPRNVHQTMNLSSMFHRALKFWETPAHDCWEPIQQGKHRPNIRQHTVHTRNTRSSRIWVQQQYVYMYECIYLYI